MASARGREGRVGLAEALLLVSMSEGSTKVMSCAIEEIEDIDQQVVECVVVVTRQAAEALKDRMCHTR